MARTDKRHAITINGVFNGIYEWGRGFMSREIADKWNWFWSVEFRKTDHLFWKYADGDMDFGECGILSCNSGSIYMHPMDFNAVLVSSMGCICTKRGDDGKEYITQFESEIKHLKEICDACAEFCGGSFTLYISPEYPIEVVRPEEEYTGEIEKGEYAKRFGVEREKGSYIY